MTACSNHPATVKGAELQRLVVASDNLQSALRERVSTIAVSFGIDYQAYELLVHLVNGRSRTEERGLTQLRMAGLVTGEVPEVLVTTEGYKAHATISRAQFEWLDNAATQFDIGAVRSAIELLGRVARR